MLSVIGPFLHRVNVFKAVLNPVDVIEYIETCSGATIDLPSVIYELSLLFEEI